MKQDFPILKNGLVYLDSSATSQKPTVVIDAIKKYYEEGNANVHRGVYALSEKSTQLFEKAHESVARFIGADKDEIIFTSGTTQSLNEIAWMIDIKEGDEIILTEMEHHSNIIPWQEVAKVKGAVIKYIPLKEYRIDLQKAKELITEKTKVVSVSHMSNVLGTINPVNELALLAHNVDALLVVDAAQSVPHIPVNVKELHCDFLAFSGHKMYGPTGIGVLYGKKELLEKMDPVIYGGGMVKDVTKETATWGDVPTRFEAGTPNIAGAVGLTAAVQYLQQIGMYKVKEHGKELTTYALEKLPKVEGLTIIGPMEGKRGPVISFTLEGVHPHDVAEILDKHNIAVRGGHHCAMPLMKSLEMTGTTRVSFGMYNTKEDVDRLVQALQKVVEVFA